MATYSRTLSGLAPGEDYIIRVRSISQVGVLSDWSDSIRITPPAVSGPNYGIPGAVANISVTPGMRILYLNFDANTENGLTGYNIHVSDTASFTADATNFIKTIAPTTFTAVEKYYDTTATVIKDMVSSTTAAPTTYYIKIYAVSIGGISPTATEVSGSPGQVDENTIAEMSIDKLRAGDLTVAMGLTSGVIQTAATGTRFTIDSNNIKGYRSDNSVWYDLNRGTETLTVGANGFNADTSGNIWSGSSVYGSAPFRVSSGGAVTATNLALNGGSININSGVFQVSSAGALTASSVTITGGDLNIGAGTFHVDSLGNLTTSSVTITGGSLSINGGVFQVSSAGAVTASNVDITGGTLNIGANFSVSNAGVVTASGASITGVINATSGTFSGGITSTATITGGKIQTAASGIRAELSTGTTGRELKFYSGLGSSYSSLGYDSITDSFQIDGNVFPVWIKNGSVLSPGFSVSVFSTIVIDSTNNDVTIDCGTGKNHYRHAGTAILDTTTVVKHHHYSTTVNAGSWTYLPLVIEDDKVGTPIAGIAMHQPNKGLAPIVRASNAADKVVVLSSNNSTLFLS